jgi:general L-amino acid transport system substrate-binding protein
MRHKLRSKSSKRAITFRLQVSKKLPITICVGLILLFVVFQIPAYSQTSSRIAQSNNSRLATVTARGRLICGVEGFIPGFSFKDTQGRYSGLDVDICRAIAAALFADPNRLDFRNLDSTERFPALAKGDVDLLSRNSSWTASRDATGGNGFDFAPPTFIDGQGIIARKDSGLKRLQDLQGKTVCVEMDTLTEVNFKKITRAAGMTLNLRRTQNSRQNFNDYADNQCEAITADRSQLAVFRLSMQTPDDHQVWNTLLSIDPLAPLTVDNDAQWADVVHWVIYGLIKAEEYGITQENVRANIDSSDPETTLFLGKQGDVGKKLGLSHDFMVRVIQSVGNYGEIYDRNFGSRTPINLARGANSLWSMGGLMYAPNWR